MLWGHWSAEKHINVGRIMPTPVACQAHDVQQTHDAKESKEDCINNLDWWQVCKRYGHPSGSGGGTSEWPEDHQVVTDDEKDSDQPTWRGQGSPDAVYGLPPTKP